MTKASDYFPYWKSYFTCGYGEKYQGRMRCGPISIISMFFILVKISSWWATMLPVWRGNFCSGTSWDSCNLTTKNCHKTLEFVSRTLFSRGIPSLTRSTRHNLWGNLEQVFHRHGHLTYCPTNSIKALTTLGFGLHRNESALSHAHTTTSATEVSLHPVVMRGSGMQRNALPSYLRHDKHYRHFKKSLKSLYLFRL